MTTYTAISNALVAVGAKPFATTIQALRDNAIAIGEADATVPANLRPSVFLGAITTTTGSTQTLSGLVLTPYKMIYAFYAGISGVSAITGISVSLGGRLIGTAIGTETFSGLAIFDLGSASMCFASYRAGDGTVLTSVAAHTLTTASTSISAVATGTTYDAGSIRIYGVK